MENFSSHFQYYIVRATLIEISVMIYVNFIPRCAQYVNQFLLLVTQISDVVLSHRQCVVI